MDKQMKQINNYIQEKLHINKDYKSNPFYDIRDAVDNYLNKENIPQHLIWFENESKVDRQTIDYQKNPDDIGKILVSVFDTKKNIHKIKDDIFEIINKYVSIINYEIVIDDTMVFYLDKKD